MATLCSMSGTCDESQIISIGRVIGIVIGCFIALAAVTVIIVIIKMLCKKKRQPTVWVQSSQNAAVGYNSSMNMGYYSPYNQSSAFYEPPPAYQEENVSIVSDGKMQT